MSSRNAQPCCSHQSLTMSFMYLNMLPLIRFCLPMSCCVCSCLCQADRPAWLSVSAVDVLQGDAPAGAARGAVLRSPAALVGGRGQPHVFLLRGLRAARRSAIRIDGLADSETRRGILHTPPAPSHHQSLRVVVVSGHDPEALARDTPPRAASQAAGTAASDERDPDDAGPEATGEVPPCTLGQRLLNKIFTPCERLTSIYIPCPQTVPGGL